MHFKYRIRVENNLCPLSNERIYTENSQEVAFTKNFHSGVEKGMLPTSVSTWSSKNKSSFLLSTEGYVRLHKQTGPNCCRKDLAAWWVVLSLLTQPQQKVLHVQSHIALLITEPQLRSIALKPPQEAGSLIFDPNVTGRPPPAIQIKIKMSLVQACSIWGKVLLSPLTQVL